MLELTDGSGSLPGPGPFHSGFHFRPGAPGTEGLRPGTPEVSATTARFGIFLPPGPVRSFLSFSAPAARFGFPSPAPGSEGFRLDAPEQGDILRRGVHHVGVGLGDLPFGQLREDPRRSLVLSGLTGRASR